MLTAPGIPVSRYVSKVNIVRFRCQEESYIDITTGVCQIME